MSKEQLVKDSLDYLRGQSRRLSQPFYLICSDVINDHRFINGFGAHTIHHAYKGGLAVHTAEVLSYALNIAMSFRDRANFEVITTTAIVHDYYKIHDYSWDEDNQEILKTDYRAKIRHLAGSYGWFMQQVAKYSIASPEVEQIEHALLAHHGRQGWGSPVEPQTLEAFIIHSADMLSAMFGDNR